jgi:sulfur-carrier protein adenylyltransferase/sulfurtransferase
VIGLGSIGSKIAESLLRSGVHALVLADGDILLPGNLERHTLDWRDIGHRKAYALERRLRQIVPGAALKLIPRNLNWQISARLHAEDIGHVASCDVIVDATGDPATSMFLGAIAADNGKPFVTVVVFEGGLGCLITRSIPSRSPSYVSGRAAYTAYCEQRNVKPPVVGQRPYQVLSEEGETFVADDAAVTIAAGHAARAVLDILDGPTPDDHLWLLFGFQRGWLFEGHGHTIVLDVGEAPASQAVHEDAEMRTFALTLFEEALRATSASS